MRSDVASSRRPPAVAREWLRRPEVRTDLIQVLKAVLATVTAWLIATWGLDLEQPFLAPWAALLAVHITVHSSVWRGAQTIGATFLGIIVSFLAVLALGYGVLTLALAVLVGLLLSRLSPLRTEGVTAATTALFVLTSSTGDEAVLLLDRLADTLIGVGVGIVVNLLVVPPLDDHLAERQLDRVRPRLGKLLQQISSDLSLPASREHAQAWIAQTRTIDADLDHGEVLLRHARDSQQWNPRRNRSKRASDPEHDHALLLRLEDGMAQIRSMARTLGESVVRGDDWDPRFRDPWLRLLDDLGARLADPEATLEGMTDQVDDLVRNLSGEDLPGLLWPMYGDLVTSVRTIIVIIDDVDSTRPSPHANRPG